MQVYVIWSNQLPYIISIHETKESALQVLRTLDKNFKESAISESDSSELGRCNRSGYYCTEMILNTNTKKLYLLEIFKNMRQDQLDAIYFLCPTLNSAIRECLEYFESEYAPGDITENELRRLKTLKQGYDVPIFITGADYFYDCMITAFDVKKLLK